MEPAAGFQLTRLSVLGRHPAFFVIAVDYEIMCSLADEREKVNGYFFFKQEHIQNKYRLYGLTFFFVRAIMAKGAWKGGGKVKRMIVIAGHYGSGKTELAVSLAMDLAKRKSRSYPRLAIVDLDVANPYFRSRERMDILEANGVQVYGDAFHSTGATAELPALTAALRAPLEDDKCQTIVDLGGNDAGARVLRQFEKYFQGDQYELWAVVNFRRYETQTLKDARDHVESIQNELGLRVTGLVNNTHLLRETTAEILREGYEKAAALSREMEIPLLFTCYPAGLIDPSALGSMNPLMPLGLYMRPAYLDK